MRGDGSEEVAGEFVEAGCDPAEMLELAEEAFDRISAAVKLGFNRALHDAMGRAGDVRPGASADDEIENRVAIVSSVGNDVCVGREVGK
jgi:hypothetical protein